MGQDEPIVTDHDWTIDGFGNPVCLNDRIQDFLVVAAVDLHPSRIPLGQGILLIVEDRPGGTDTAVDAAHDDGQTRTGRPVELFVHIEKSVRAGGGKDPGADRGCGYTDGQCGMFPFHPDIFGLQFAAFHILGQDFGQLGLRGNGIGGNHFHVTEFCPQSGRLITGHNLDVTH
jgi:hypothetical protein